MSNFNSSLIPGWPWHKTLNSKIGSIIANVIVLVSLIICLSPFCPISIHHHLVSHLLDHFSSIPQCLLWMATMAKMATMDTQMVEFRTNNGLTSRFTKATLRSPKRNEFMLNIKQEQMFCFVLWQAKFMTTFANVSTHQGCIQVSWSNFLLFLPQVPPPWPFSVKGQFNCWSYRAKRDRDFLTFISK